MLVSGIGVLAGCGKEPPAEIDWTVDLSKPIDLKGIYPYMGASTRSSDTEATIEEKTGYKVEYSELSESGGDADVRNILTTKQKYHFLKLDSAQYNPYLKQEKFLDLTELLEKTPAGRKLYQLIDLMDYGWEAVTYVDEAGQKHIYGIPDYGYCVMTDSALIWNLEHLKECGFKNADGSAKVPTTMSEMNDALYAMQAKYGGNKAYHALGLPGQHSCEVTPIKGAFEVPFQFYVDDEGNIQQYIFSENTLNYTKYMSELKRDEIISNNWQKSSAGDSCSQFAKGNYSCVFLPYWYVSPLLEACAAQNLIAPGKDAETIKTQYIAWSTRIRGDGTHNTIVQEEARTEGGEAGVSYYTVIPEYMAADALYIIDFLSKKMEAFSAYYGGQEGVHYNRIDAPQGAPEYDGTKETNAKIAEYEDYGARKIFLKPWEFEYYDYEPIYEDVLQEDGVTTVKTLTGAKQGELIKEEGGGYWIELTDRYIKQIVNNSQYCNGTNKVSANRLFHLRETGFNGWPVAVDDDETIIHNPMAMMPPLEHWAPISIQARTLAKDGIKAGIQLGNPEKAEEKILQTRNSMFTKKKKENGVSYYYWSDDIINEMTVWYKTVKLGITE
ncbi:MAG: extracellular solute-binding protein [Oscillospiraceae bacterium]|nr:extracellular solute-binding protein [Oscillospiraceae bacterium]